VLISNIKGWKSHLVPIVILIIIAGFMELRSQIRDNIRENYYQNGLTGDYMAVNYESTRSPKDLLVTTIPSDIIQESILKIFLEDLGAFSGIYQFDNKLFAATKWVDLNSDSVSRYFQKRLRVKIDDKPIENIRWFKSQHPATLSFGFNAFIDIKDLERGEHYLHLGIDTTGMSPIAKGIVEKDDYSLQTISNIYFIYDKQ
ncbi:MAG: hypothetical protein AAF391_04620, partial [Bacteroidota bacterium]